MTRHEMFAKGILKAGQEVQLLDRPYSKAVIVDRRHVKFEGEIKTFTAWATELTGWKGINIFKNVELTTGESLADLRQRHMK